MKRQPPLFADLAADGQRLVGQVFCALAVWEHESGKRLVAAPVSGDLWLSGGVRAEYRAGRCASGQGRSGAAADALRAGRKANGDLGALRRLWAGLKSRNLAR
jgi:hypothetical protein